MGRPKGSKNKSSEKESAPYKAKIKILGRVYEATGRTAKEAIENISPLGVAKGMSILTISKEDVKKDRILTAQQTFRLFSGGRIMREIALKQISMLFDFL